MVPKRIILEGKSYLMLEENLGRLQYNPFKQGSINSKHYSDYEPITAVGIAPVETVTRKTIDKKKVEVQDLKFAIKFKWNVDVLASNPDLFLRYYNYFEDAPQTKDGKKAGVASNTINDFMPFINDAVYSKTFNQILAGAGEGGDLDDDSVLNEATAPSRAEVNDLADNVDSFDDAFTDIEPGDEIGDGVGAVSADDNGILAGGSKDITRIAGKDFYFYLVFKYDELYDNDARMRQGGFHDGSNIEIIKLVSAGHVDDANVAITGRVLEKKAIGFYRELLGILNANHKTILAMVHEEEKELGLDTSLIPTENEELNFDDHGVAVGDGVGSGDFEADVLPDEPVNPSYQTVEDANANAKRDVIANAPSTPIEDYATAGGTEREKALNRFKQASGV